MKKFIVLYLATEEALKEMKPGKSPEEIKKGMEPWMKWAERCGDKLVDLGKPLGKGLTMKKEGEFPGDKNLVGFSILQGEDIEQIKNLLENHPHLEWREDCSLEVYPMMPLPGQ